MNSISMHNVKKVSTEIGTLKVDERIVNTVDVVVTYNDGRETTINLFSDEPIIVENKK